MSVENIEQILCEGLSIEYKKLMNVQMDKLEVFSHVVHFPIGLVGFGAILTPNGHFEDWPPWRSDGLKSLGT